MNMYLHTEYAAFYCLYYLIKETSHLKYLNFFFLKFNFFLKNIKMVKKKYNPSITV